MVAMAGMIRNTGERKSAKINRIPVTSEVIPLLPPSAIPVALSTQVVTVEVPHNAPNEVAIASAYIACLMFFTLPFSSISSVPEAAPISVPRVLKMSIKIRENIITITSSDRTDLKSNWKKVGDMDCGVENGTKPSGIWVIPKGMPITVVAMMAIKNAPFTLKKCNTPVRIIETMANMV